MVYDKQGRTNTLHCTFNVLDLERLWTRIVDIHELMMLYQMPDISLLINGLRWLCPVQMDETLKVKVALEDRNDNLMYRCSDCQFEIFRSKELGSARCKLVQLEEHVGEGLSPPGVVVPGKKKRMKYSTTLNLSDSMYKTSDFGLRL